MDYSNERKPTQKRLQDDGLRFENFTCYPFHCVCYQGLHWKKNFRALRDLSKEKLIHENQLVSVEEAIMTQLKKLQNTLHSSFEF